MKQLNPKPSKQKYHSSLRFPSLSPIYLHISWRNIIRHRRRSFLTITAVSFSIFCLIVFQAMKGGLHQKMMESSLGLDTGIIQIHAAGSRKFQTRIAPLPDGERLLKLLEETGINTYAKRLKAPALLLAGKQSSSIQLSGIVPAEEALVTFIHQRVISGTYFLKENEILLGDSLAKDLQVGIGDEVKVMLQNIHGQPRIARLRIGGTFLTGLDSFDRSHGYLQLQTAGRLIDLDPHSNFTEITLSGNPADTKKISAGLKRKFTGFPIQIQTWPQLAPDLAQLITLNNATFNLLILIVFAIVAMGITNTMTTVTFERFREFGVLSAIGTTPREIMLLVVSESFLLGLLGGIFGTSAALLASIYLKKYGLDLAYFTSSNQYFVAGSVLKSVLTLQDVTRANLITLITAILSGLYPAGKAAKLEPVKAITHI